VIDPVAVAPEKLKLLGETVNAHAASCVSVYVTLPTEMVPIRWLVVVLADAVHRTVPLPVPLEEVSVIHGVVVVAVQEHSVVTPNEPDPPVAGAVPRFGLIWIVQVPAAWLIVSVCPATVMIPVRALGVLFAWTV
jgi:hypothetical protein